MARRLEDAGRRRDRPAVAVRGGDPRRGDRAQPRRSSRAPSTSPRRSTTSRRSTTFVGAADRYLAALERVKAARRRPGHRQPQRDQRRRLGPLRAAASQDAGADALELNLYHVAADPRPDGRRHGGRRPRRSSPPSAPRSTIPLAVKLSPYYSAFANFAAAVVGAGADGLVLFNRFYQPDLDLDDARGRARGSS